MTVTSGTRFGPYEILSPIGAGGMGEVYRANDTRLDRIVAIKVLSPHLSGDLEGRERFVREARTISSLNHPHICTLFDVGNQDGVDFLVMEYLEGETLDKRLAKGPLPRDQVMRYAIEISDALDKAHRQGIIHRDLKPANIMLTKLGAKLLDFGLAKLRQTGSGPLLANLSTLPTEAHDLTSKGTVLGTFRYMAPEQLEGKEADARTDIFAFGLVVYEMVTGRKAFEAKSPASLIAEILSAEPPPISNLQPYAPATLDRVVSKCLAKDPDLRWQSMHDLTSELQWIAEGGSKVGAAAPGPMGAAAPYRTRERFLSFPTVLFFISTLVLALVVAYLLRRTPVVHPIRLALLPPEKATFESFAASPDGRSVAFAAHSEGKNLLWVRSLDSASPQPLLGTESAYYPFWSPDNRFIGFFVQGKLKKIEVSGGPAQALCDAPDGRGGAWNREGVIIFVPNPNSPVYRVSDSGGETTPVTTLDKTHQVDTHR
ncbi:MAG TPA: protein kinase, partial [Acidobacteriota bacterium]|nr:protein kinase [Acidobacteriota bacterium]